MDNIWDIFEFTEFMIDFYEYTGYKNNMKLIDVNKPQAEQEYLELFLRAESFERMYKLEYYDLLSYLGDLGGLLDVILIIGCILSGFIASRMFQAALV